MKEEEEDPPEQWNFAFSLEGDAESLEEIIESIKEYAKEGKVKSFVPITGGERFHIVTEEQYKEYKTLKKTADRRSRLCD